MEEEFIAIPEWTVRHASRQRYTCFAADVTNCAVLHVFIAPCRDMPDRGHPGSKRLVVDHYRKLLSAPELGGVHGLTRWFDGLPMRSTRSRRSDAHVFELEERLKEALSRSSVRPEAILPQGPGSDEMMMVNESVGVGAS